MNDDSPVRVRHLATRVYEKTVATDESEVKIAGLTEKQKKKAKRIAAFGLGAGLLAGAGLTLRHKGMRSHLKAKLKSVFADKETRAATTKNMSSLRAPQFARGHIDDVMASLQEQGYSRADLAKMKIGVVGTGGTGKSSLALALQEKAPDLTHLNLDSGISKRPGRMGTADVVGALKQQGGIRPGTISDQVQLLHDVDPSEFDLLIKVKRDAADIKRDLYDRGHYGFVADYTDIGKAQDLVDDAFNMSGGQRISVNKNIDISLNPNSASAQNQRKRAAERLGFDMDAFTNLSQRDQLVSLSKGKISKGESWRSSISSGQLERDAAAAAAAGLGGGYYGSRGEPEDKRKRKKLSF